MDRAGIRILRFQVITQRQLHARKVNLVRNGIGWKEDRFGMTHIDLIVAVVSFTPFALRVYCFSYPKNHVFNF
jgi:hypothetical protein